MFCPKCGGLLRPRKSGNKIVKYCSCGYTSKNIDNEGLLIKERSNLEKKDKIEVIDRVVETLPKVNEECSRCGNNEAYYWQASSISSSILFLHLLVYTNILHV